MFFSLKIREKGSLIESGSVDMSSLSETSAGTGRPSSYSYLISVVRIIDAHFPRRPLRLGLLFWLIHTQVISLEIVAPLQ